MKIFRATDLRINPIPIIADDIHHASHMLLFALHDGLRHWPGVSYSLGPWTPPADMEPDLLKELADNHPEGLAHFIEGGWKVIHFEPHRTYP